MIRPALIISMLWITSIAFSGCATNLFGSLRPSQEQKTEAEAVSYSAWNHDYNQAVGAGIAAPARMPQSTRTARADLETSEGIVEDAVAPADGESRAPASVIPQTSAIDQGGARNFKNGLRATRSDFVDDAPNAGSLWASDGQTNYYFTKNKIKSVGDILSIQIEADMVKEIQSEIKRTLPTEERENELALVRKEWETNRDAAMAAAELAEAKSAVKGEKKPERAPASTGATSAGATTEAKPAVEPSYANVDLSKSVEIKAGDTMMVEIVDRFPNGNYKIRGLKRVGYKNGTAKYIGVTAVVRAADLGDEETLTSGKLYEHRVEAIRN